MLSGYRPDWAIRVLAVLTGAVIAMSIWFAISPEGWRSFEDRNGPIRTIVVFALAAVVSVLGLKRTWIAGWMLLVLGIAPIFISSVGSDPGTISLFVASSAPVITGVLYLISARMTHRSEPPRGVEEGLRVSRRQHDGSERGGSYGDHGSASCRTRSPDDRSGRTPAHR